jgi:acyl dehydratase
MKNFTPQQGPQTMAEPARLYLDDLKVGLRFSSPEYRVDEQQIIAFGKQFDPQPFHTDPVAAKDTFFRGLAASGWHTMAITMNLIVASVPLAGGVVGAGAELDWPSATRPGDVLRVESTIVDIKPSKSKPGRAVVFLESRTLNQNDEVRLRKVAKLLAFKKTA